MSNTIIETIAKIALSAKKSNVQSVFEQLDEHTIIEVINVCNDIINDSKHSMRVILINDYGVKKDVKSMLQKSMSTFQLLYLQTVKKGKKEEIAFTDILIEFDLNELSQNKTDIVAISQEVEKYGAIYDRDFPFVFLRKSTAGQSKVDLLESVKGLRCSGFLLGTDSSGFDDIAILRALKVCLESNITDLKVLMAKGSSRSIYATATRNPSVAQALCTYSRLLGVDIDIGGSISGVGGAIFKLMVSLQGSSEWLGNANTTHSAKHHDYLEFISMKPLERMTYLKTATNRFKQEFEVFIEKNGSEKKVKQFLINMIDKPSHTINKSNKVSVFCTVCYRK